MYVSVCVYASESMIIAEGKRKERASAQNIRTWQSRVTHNYRTPVAANTQNNHGKTKWNFVTLCRCLLWLFFSCPPYKVQ